MAFEAILAIVAVLTFAQGAYQASIYGMQGLRIFGNTTEKRDFISKYEVLSGFDFFEFARNTDSPIEVLVAPNKLNQFKIDLDEENIKYDIFIKDVGKALEKSNNMQERGLKLRSNTKNILDAFPRHAEIIAYLKAIATKYNNIAETFSIGESYEGRDLLGLKISSGSGSKPAVVIDAGIHAREWIALTTALYAIHQLVKNSGNHYLFQDVDIYIIPSLNPDGYEFTHESIQNRLWRKTVSRHSADSNCFGVDANRNFDSAWMTAGASSDPCSEIYAGPRAFSEPETVALRKFMLSLKGRLKTYISLHSYGQYLLHPWGFTRTPPKMSRQLKCVAQVAASALSRRRGNQYKIGSPVEILYAASGGSMDWAMAEAGAEMSYTIELPGGLYRFAPPPREIKPVGRETFDALAVLIKHASKRNQFC